MKLTRLEIADHVSGAFHAPKVSKTELIEAASASRAPSEVLCALGSLPDAQFHSLRDLWPHLPEVPVSL
jgi:Protein of unknown function (DUF2795)